MSVHWYPLTERERRGLERLRARVALAAQLGFDEDDYTAAEATLARLAFADWRRTQGWASDDGGDYVDPCEGLPSVASILVLMGGCVAAAVVSMVLAVTL